MKWYELIKDNVITRDNIIEFWVQCELVYSYDKETKELTVYHNNAVFSNWKKVSKDMQAFIWYIGQDEGFNGKVRHGEVV